MLMHLPSAKQDSAPAKATATFYVLHTEQVSAVHYFLITSFIKATAHLLVNLAI